MEMSEYKRSVMKSGLISSRSSSDSNMDATNINNNNVEKEKHGKHNSSKAGSFFSKLQALTTKVSPNTIEKTILNVENQTKPVLNGHVKTPLLNGHGTISKTYSNVNDAVLKQEVESCDSWGQIHYSDPASEACSVSDSSIHQRKHLDRIEETGLIADNAPSNKDNTNKSNAEQHQVNQNKPSTVRFEDEIDSKQDGASKSSVSSPEYFEKQLHNLVQEITTKVLIAQPDGPKNLYTYIADYLEDKMKRERRHVEVKKPKNVLKRQNSKVGKMLFRHATLLAKSSLASSQSSSGEKLSFLQLIANAQAANNQKVYYELPKEPNTLTFTGHKKAVTQCAFYKHYIITSSLDTSICIYDISSNRRVISIPNHKPVHCFVVIPSGDQKVLILAGTEDGQVPGWKVKFGNRVNAKLKVLIPMHQPNPIRAMKTSPNLKYLATGCCFEMTQISLWGFIEPSVRGTLKTWDLTQVMNYVLDPKNYYDDIEHLGLKTYKQIIARTEKLTQRMASYSKLTENDSTDESFHGIKALVFTPDESKIIVGFGHPDRQDVKDIKMIAVVESHSLETLWIQYASFYQINSMDFDPTCGKPGGTWPWAFYVSTERHLYRAELELKDETNEKSKIKIKIPWRLDFETTHTAGAFSPDGNIVVSSSGKQVLIFEASTGKQLGSYSGHADDITCLAFNEEYICSSSKDKTVKVWKVPIKSNDTPKKFKKPVTFPFTRVHNENDSVGVSKNDTTVSHGITSLSSTTSSKSMDLFDQKMSRIDCKSDSDSSNVDNNINTKVLGNNDREMITSPKPSVIIVNEKTDRLSSLSSNTSTTVSTRDKCRSSSLSSTASTITSTAIQELEELESQKGAKSKRYSAKRDNRKASSKQLFSKDSASSTTMRRKRRSNKIGVTGGSDSRGRSSMQLKDYSSDSDV